MIDPRKAGRPLDEREAREFERLVAAFAAPDPATPPPVKASSPVSRYPPLTWRQVALVLLASAVFAALTATLPTPLNLWAPVVVLVVLALACVVWGRRAERSRTD